uniref:serine/threonine-protein kinase n=1 Tax=Aquisphaera insulae TaxID=2712864 RepID=UPI0013EC8DD7
MMAGDEITWHGLEDEQVCEVLAAYFEELEAGHGPDPRELIARHPEMESRLSEFFSARRMVSGLAKPDHERGFAATAIDAEPIAGRASSPFDGSPSVDKAAAEGYRILGDHLLLNAIKGGGMGLVYRAWHRSLRRVVAVKVVRSGQFATPAERRRFQAETEAVAALDHPNIVPIHDVGHDNGCDYYSMKFIEGSSLADRLGDFRDDPRGAARVVASVAQAIFHAHQRGVLHRDLKPSNILLDGDGQPYVTDFGLAKRAGDPELTVTGEVLGSPPYMAPEQTAGTRGCTTVATDVYGLGAILYALLAGRPPFRAGSVIETIDLVRSQPPAPPRRINPLVDLDLQTICLKCLEKDPDSRYPSARELSNDLQRWLGGEPIRARAASLSRRAYLWCRHPDRQKQSAFLAFLIGLYLCVFCMFGMTLVGSGVTACPNPPLQLLLLSCWLVPGYLPVVLWSWLARRGRWWAFCLGLVQSVVLLTVLSLFMLSLCSFGTQDLFVENPYERSFSHSSVFAIFLLLTLSFAEGTYSMFANRRCS